MLDRFAFLFADTHRTAAYRAEFARRGILFGHEVPIIGHVNDMADALSGLNPEAVVYSGKGGQIVGANVLRVAPFLHAHAGWLPDYRGSTTIFYSLIERGDCAVSVIQLGPGIDDGPALARKRFPVAPNLDEYDSTIRASLMADVLEHRIRTGALPDAVTQDGVGRTFYVAHPVLRHIAARAVSQTALGRAAT